MAAGWVSGSPGDVILKLLPDDGNAADFFGQSVGVSGATAVVGTPQDSDMFSIAGSIYIFNTETGQMTWEVYADDPEAAALFGYSVAISGATAIVGAPLDDEVGADSGSAYLIDTITGQQLTKLVPLDGEAGERFGWDVAVDGSIAVVGAYLDDDNGQESGSAYIFDVTTGDQLFKLLPDDGQHGDQFGVAVDVSDTTIIVGSWQDDDNGNFSGSAYLFDATTGLQIDKLLPLDGSSADLFGREVAIDGAIAAIGAHGAGPAGGGAAYIFDTSSGQQLHRLEQDGGGGQSSFGWAVAVNGNTAVVGHHQDGTNGVSSGAVYIFDVATGDMIVKVIPDDNSENDRFGERVSVDGGAVLAGASFDDDNGANSGSAYVIEGVIEGLLFADGFESGDVGGWSAVHP